MADKTREAPRIRVKRAPAEITPEALLFSKSHELCLNLLQQVEMGRFVLKFPSLRRFAPGSGRPLFAAALAGRGRFSLPDESLILGAGEMAILPGHAACAAQGPDEPPREILTVSLYPRAIGLSLHGAGDPSHLQLASPGAELLGLYLGQILEMGRRSDWQAKLGAKGLLLAYLSALDAALPRRGAPKSGRPAAEKARVAAIRRLIQEELANPALGAAFLAGKLRCSADYLSHLFRQETGRRLAAYITAERVEAARELLRRTALTVAEIAFAVGFENPGYFARVFKASAGAAPGEYRRGLDPAEETATVP
ncbi:MAG: helix-turn-helix transcriptional regulator [Verrucomicrobium sp.]|nr:helix-turn-helix transcriptional regulator [Verrucomicrobium sp.]